MSVDEFRSVLDRLRVARMELDDCESLELGYPFIDDVWNAYLTARIDTENAITDLVQELCGFYVLAQIKNMRVYGVE